ncbi:MAG: hypothetical protein U1E50_09590 [Caulobacteraceae bacterium]
MSTATPAPTSLSDIAAAARAAKGRFGPGNSGRPLGSKNKRPRKQRFDIGGDILRDFHKNHKTFLAAYREEDPDGYLSLVAVHLQRQATPGRKK